MALTIKDLIQLAKIAATADKTSPVAYSFGEDKFSYNEINDTLRKELNELAGTYALYRENKNTIFQIMEETVDTVLPQKVMEQYGQFAQVKTFAQGDTAVFYERITPAAKRRAKKFVTKVGLAGIYEVFKLDGRSFRIETNAYGGAAQIAFEEFLDGRIQMSDVLDIVMEGLDERVYEEIEKALVAAMAKMPAANVKAATGFDETEMDRLLTIADSYGGNSVIYCAPEFAYKMKPAEEWRWSEDMKNQHWNNGHFTNYKNHTVVIFNQSFTDETNETKVVDPSYAWIIPAGAEKPVKIVMEGQTIVRDIDNADMSKEVQIYKKFGVGVVATNNICVYEDLSL